MIIIMIIIIIIIIMIIIIIIIIMIIIIVVVVVVVIVTARPSSGRTSTSSCTYRGTVVIVESIAEVHLLLLEEGVVAKVIVPSAGLHRDVLLAHVTCGACMCLHLAAPSPADGGHI
jgi:hypothetical protein